MLITLIVSAAIIAAIVAAVRHVRKKGSGCSSCDGCPMAGRCRSKRHS